MNANNTSPQQLSAAAIAALQRGNKIDAIKIARQEMGLGLKEAKDLIEAYIADNPALQEQLRMQSRGGLLGWIFMIIVALVAIVYFWPRR